MKLKIISKFKDYYDYIGHQMGMIDPKIVYDRNVKLSTTAEIKKLIIKINPFPYSCYKLLAFDMEIKFLCVNGKMYTLYRMYTKEKNYKVLSKDIFDQYFRKVFYYKNSHSFNPYDKSFLIDDLSIAIGQPVFIINRYYPSQRNESLYIEESIPILQNLNFPSIQAPQILYQELEHYISNVLRTNPDTLVPVEVEDKHKITQHGFDIKQSFRHRN